MLTYYYWPVPAGGAENQCRRLAGVLAERGHHCLILTCRCRSADARQQQEKNRVDIVRVLSLELLLQLFQKAKSEKRKAKTENCRYAAAINREVSLSKIKLLTSINKLIRYCNIAVFSLAVLFFLLRKHSSFDILHVHTADWIAGLAAFAGKIFKLPVICKGADLPVFPPFQAVPLAACCDRWRRKPYFIALTSAMKNDLIQQNVPESKITIIPNGVSIPAQTASVEINNYFLYIGNFSQTAAHKAFDVLIEAWGIFHQLRPDFRLLLLGGGDQKPWQQLAERLCCLDSIDFLGYQENLFQFFIKSCCFLLPSRKEGISNALLEAQSWGIPAIVSDIPGNREIVSHQENGLIVPINDCVALSNSCVYLADRPNLRAKYGKSAINKVERSFDIELISKNTIKLYKKIIDIA